MNNGDMNNLNNTNNTNVVPTTPVVPAATQPQEAAGVVLPNSQPVLNAATDTAQPAFTPTVVTTENVTEQVPAKEEDGKKKKRKNNNGGGSSSLTFLFFLVAVGLGFYAFYSNNLYKANLQNLQYNCTPVSSYKEEKKLDLNSTVVVELYDKVKTSIREDYAQPEFNDNMKLYLAFRQIPDHKFYSSNCNMFKAVNMEPYKCDSKTFTPKAFKVEDLEHQLRVLFGEETKIPLGNIKLKNLCIGGYMYIPERGEYVEGECKSDNAVMYSVEKKLVDATTNRNTITLVEEVKYLENEKLKLPEYLKSGRYYYTFRLDMNYNYVLISRTYESKY